MLAGVVACGLLMRGPAANAQPATAPAPSARSDAPQMIVNFGYQGTQVFWPGRWAPVEVTLSLPVSATAPFDGRLVIQYAQDGPVWSRTQRAVACSAGKPATYQVMVNVGRGCSTFNIVLEDRRGREVVTQKYSSGRFGEDDTARIADVASTGTGVVLGVGEATGAARSIAYASNRVIGESAFGPSAVRCVTGGASSLPGTWTGYDSLVLLAIDASVLDRVDPRVPVAIREWVSSGGRLVVFVDQAGTRCDGLFAEGAGSLFWIEDVLVGPAPAEADAVLNARVAKTVTEHERAMRGFENSAAAAPHGDESAKPTETALEPAIERLRPAEQVTQRRVGLTEAGRAAGWRGRWHPASADDREPESAMLVEGPYGFGWMVIVGVHPSQLAETGGEQATRAAWASIVESALADFRTRIPKTTSGDTTYAYEVQYGSPSMSAPGDTARAAKEAVVNRLANVPTVGNAVFFALAGGLLLLGVLVGPVDALALRRAGAQHHSWATSLLWIALASVLAYWLPMLVRSGPTLVNRVTIIDAVVPPASDEPHAGVCWRTAYTGVYATTTTSSSLMDETGAGDGQWWRGISARQQLEYGNTAPATTNAFLQSLPDFSSLIESAGGESRGARGRGGNTMLSCAFKLWTFRLFADDGSASLPMGVRVRRAPPAAESPPALLLELTDLPAGARIQRAAVCSGGLWYAAGDDIAMRSTTSDARGSTRRTLELPRGDESSCRRVWLNDEARADLSDRQYPAFYNSYPRRRSQGAAATLNHPGQLFDLPGPDRRSQVVGDVLADAGPGPGRAVVYLQISDMPSDVTFKGPATYTHDMIVRAIVTIDPAHGETSDPPGPPTGGKP